MRASRPLLRLALADAPILERKTGRTLKRSAGLTGMIAARTTCQTSCVVFQIAVCSCSASRLLLRGALLLRAGGKIPDGLVGEASGDVSQNELGVEPAFDRI